MSVDSLTVVFFALLLGLCVGSFLNVLIYRLPKMMQQQWQQEASEILELAPTTEPPTFNLSLPRSHCPSCKTPIAWFHNIPLLSFLVLRGKCQHCHSSIGWRYPLVELSTGVLTAFAATQATSPFEFVLIATLLWGLIALILIDYDSQLLPDSLTLPLLWLGLIANSFGTFTDIHSALWGAIIGYMSLWSIYWLFKIMTGKEGMGAGDFKLLACIGAWLGWQALPSAILISAGVGSIIGLGLIALTSRSSQQPIPFGPFLGIAFIILLFFGNSVEQLLQTVLG